MQVIKGIMARLSLIALLSLLIGCQPIAPTAEFTSQAKTSSAQPAIEFPPPYDDNGIRIAVDGLYRVGDSVVGVTGIATNVTKRDFRQCTVNLDIVDRSGVKVGDAIASTQGLHAGQQWRFQAAFTIPFQAFFAAVRPNRVTVTAS